MQCRLLGTARDAPHSQGQPIGCGPSSPNCKLPEVLCCKGLLLLQGRCRHSRRWPLPALVCLPPACGMQLPAYLTRLAGTWRAVPCAWGEVGAPRCVHLQTGHPRVKGADTTAQATHSHCCWQHRLLLQLAGQTHRDAVCQAAGQVCELHCSCWPTSQQQPPLTLGCRALVEL